MMTAETGATTYILSLNGTDVGVYQRLGGHYGQI